jgi:hypothetical protein
MHHSVEDSSHSLTSRITPKIIIKLNHDATTSAAAAMAIHHPTTLLTAEDHRHPPHQSSEPLALAALTQQHVQPSQSTNTNSIVLIFILRYCTTFHLRLFIPKLFEHLPGHSIILYEPNMSNAAAMKNKELITVSWYCIYHYFMFGYFTHATTQSCPFIETPKL